MSVFDAPVIDLNLIQNETELFPVVKTVLNGDGIFLLKNYANMNNLKGLISHLGLNDFSASSNLDKFFSGTFVSEEGIVMEQYMKSTDGLWLSENQAPFALEQISNQLLKIALYFGKLFLEVVGCNLNGQVNFDDHNYASIISRYYSPTPKSSVDFEFQYQEEYKILQPEGLLTVFPCAAGISYKENDRWKALEKPDCILIAAGKLISNISNNKAFSARLRVPTSNFAFLTLMPPLSASTGTQTVADILLEGQITRFPEVSKEIYPLETAKLNLTARVNLCKEIFNVVDSILSLYSISRSISTSTPELQALLPNISNMLNKKVSQQQFLRMLFLWPEAYKLELNAAGEIVLGLPELGLLNALSNKSRKLEYAERANNWLGQALNSSPMQEDVPCFTFGKRRGSDDLERTSRLQDNAQEFTQAKKSRQRGYISNSKQKFKLKSMDGGRVDGSDLLERIRQKERRASALLSQRERQYQQFLNVKMLQIFDILHALPAFEPYTITHLTSLIVDSLRDSNNPVGEGETRDILMKLQQLLPDVIKAIQVEGGLLVFRWTDLDKVELKRRLDKFT
ncbi:LAMI_0D08856g1_1 [Lachancea mirantina]|uniref:LAMI_0D08856g1_1 n=1 Tax=Lachancea mirantina TaxID=1230905 RepID=A0A1G4JD73_9SACH|nr:LAMI_0D08856g1_1 [Lachancea mirantina]